MTMTRLQMIDSIIQTYIESSNNKAKIHLPALYTKDVKEWIKYNPEWEYIKTVYSGINFVMIQKKRTKKIIQVDLESLRKQNKITFARWDESQGYVMNHSYKWITQYSYARLLRTLAQYKYFGFLVTKG